MILEEKREKRPAFFFYCRDWLTSENVSAMNGNETKAYINLLAHAWLSEPAGTLPNDDRKLAALSRLGLKHWNRAKKAVLTCFKIEGERLVSERLVRLHLESVNRELTNRKRGKKGAEKRWKTVDNQLPGNSPTIPQALLNDGYASAIASAKKKKTKEELVLDVPNDLLENLPEITDWLEYKRQRGQRYKPMGLEALWRSFRSIPKEKRRASVDHCMANNWSGLFEKKGETKDLVNGQPYSNGVPSAEATKKMLKELEAM